MEVRGLFVHSKRIYFVVTKLLGHTQVDKEWQLRGVTHSAGYGRGAKWLLRGWVRLGTGKKRLEF